MSDTVLVTAAGVVLAMVLAGCVTALALVGRIDGQAAIGFFGLLAGGGVGAAAHASGVRAGRQDPGS